MARTSLESAPTRKIADETRSLLLIGVEGYDGRLNDALFRPARSRPQVYDYMTEEDCTKTLVFFGGDIQNFYHLMEQNDPEVPYHDWSLETTATRLGNDFPEHHIVVIRPSRIANKDISCYDNFVKGNIVGAPHHIYQYDSLVHLERLLLKISVKIRSMTPESLYKCLFKPGVDREEENLTPEQREVHRKIRPLSFEERDKLLWWQDNMSLHKCPLTLVGFSKGCVVLNQLLFEFHYARHLEPQKTDSRFIDRIKEMYWLDGGHPMRTNTWITARAVLQTLHNLKIKVHVHVSAYQVNDAARPWIERDEKQFMAILTSLKADVFRYFHVSENPDIYAHFAVLNKFKQAEAMFNAPTPVDATFIFAMTAFFTTPSQYALAVDYMSTIISTEEYQGREPILRQTHALTRAKVLEAGLFLTCNANLYRTQDGHELMLSVFQATGPARSPSTACVTIGVPDEPATYLAKSSESNSAEEGSSRTTYRNFRLILATKASFVANLGTKSRRKPEQVLSKLILRESHRLPPLKQTRYPRISYRFDLWQEDREQTVDYYCTLSVFKVSRREPAARIYINVCPPIESRVKGIPEDIPANDTTYTDSAILTFSVLSPIPSVDKFQNDDGSAITYYYENGHMANIPFRLCHQSPRRARRGRAAGARRSDSRDDSDDVSNVATEASDSDPSITETTASDSDQDIYRRATSRATDEPGPSTDNQD